MRLITSILLFFVLFIAQASAQDSTLIISQPVEISNDGWNKVLQLSNGNTMLFHFENRKLIRIFIFDKSGKQIAATKPELKSFDVNALDKSYFDALFECDGNAVLFATQQVSNAETMMRIIFDGNTGVLRSETAAVESASFSDEMHAYVLRVPKITGYSIVCFNNETKNDSVKTYIKRFDDKHTLIEEVKYFVPRAGYDFVFFTGARMAADGSVFIALKTEKIVQFKKQHNVAMRFIYIRPDMHTPVANTVNLPDNTNVTGISFSKNEFVNNLNIVLHTKVAFLAQIGLEKKVVTAREQMQLVLPEDLSGITEAPFEYAKAKEYMKQQLPDKTINFKSPTLLSYYTNSNGVTTAVHQEVHYEKVTNGALTEEYGMYILTKYDDNGKEMWGTVLPNSHFAITYNKLGTPVFRSRLSKTSLNDDIVITDKGNTYIVRNDVRNNFDKKIADSVASLYLYDSTDAMYYHVGRKNLIASRYFFNAPVEGEYKQLFPGSEHYDDKSKRMAVLMRKKKGKEETYHLAWRRLED